MYKHEIGKRYKILMEPKERKDNPKALPDGTIVTLIEIIGYAHYVDAHKGSAMYYYEKELIPVQDSKTAILLSHVRGLR